MRAKYVMPLKKRLLHYSRVFIKPVAKVLVLFYAIRGQYPDWLLTPDDKVSPFGSATTPTASNEPTVRKVYAKFGRYVGDVYWLAWRNATYGLAYSLKPDWLKAPDIRYEDQTFEVDSAGKKKTFWLLAPDGSWLWETQRRLGPLIFISGYRIEPAYNGAMENRQRLAAGQERAPRPGFHPNMDGRPIFSIRTARTM